MKLEGYCKKNLQEGMVVKDYRSLCEMLHEPVLKEKKKEEQLKLFSQYFSYEMVGRKIKILEVYDKPLLPEVKNDTKQYTVRVQNILLSYLSMNPNEVVYITKNELILLLGLVNKFYLNGYNNRESLLALDEEMSQFAVNNFFERSEHKNRDIIAYSLKALENKNLLFVTKTYLIYENDSFESREANEAEISYILEVKSTLLKEFGVDNEYKLFLKKKNTEFYGRLNKVLEEEMGWTTVLKVYKFIYNYKNILEEVNINQLTKEVNQLVKDALDKQADDNYEKSPYEEKHNTLLFKNKFRYYSSYPRLEKILSENLIKIPDEYFVKNIM